MNKTTFKQNLTFYLIALFLFTVNTISAQVLTCIVYDDLTLEERQSFGISEQDFLANKSSNSVSKSNIIVPKNHPITPKKFRIHFWSERSSVPALNVYTSYEMAAKYVERLNKFYKLYQICFELVGNKRTSNLVNDNYIEDAINVYISKNLPYSGAANYFSNRIYVKDSVMWWSEILLAHEVGHALNLKHTHGGFNRPPEGMCYDLYFPTNCEHVTRDPNDPDYNALTHGDEVHDTAADPGLFSSLTGDYANCYNQDANCNYIGNQVDCQGTPYLIDSSIINNIMSYGNSGCQDMITQGQVERIHYSIDNASLSTEIKKALITPSNINGSDLMLRNSELDLGFEPDKASTMFWQSPDIWVRKVDDDSLWHQNPEYGMGNNYVNVRIFNKGCTTYSGGGKLKLYWTKAGTNLPMDVWEGGNYNVNGHPLGGLIGEAELPILDSYEKHVFTFPWQVPNPANYSTISEPWHFCLLAKIESPNDVSSLPEDNGVYYHFLNSNNIALHNVSVIDNTANKSGRIHIGNFEVGHKKFKIKFSKDLFYSPNTNIFHEAEIKLTFDNKLWNIWQSGGFQGTNFNEFGEKTIIVNEDTEILLNNFPPNDFGFVDVKVNFLIDAYTSNEQFGFNVEHWDNETNELMGGELYLVNKNQRDLFNADAFVTNNTLQAISINEPAVYKWYDANGTLLHTGQNYTVSNTNGKYLLEVVADYDGYKDMKEVNITQSNTLLLHNIYPNPATSNVTVHYNQLNCNNAYLMLVNVNSNATTNYILNLNNSNININTGQYIPGLYRVVLVCDNNVVESHNLIIQ